MHLDHKIPWKTISKHFSVRNNNKLSWDGLITVDFNPRDKPSQKSELVYFSNALTNVIREFSATERKKYPNKFPAETTGKVFSDELLQRRLVLDDRLSIDFRSYLTTQNQRFEYWIQRAGAEYEQGSDTWPYSSTLSFSTSDLDLADAAKVLIVENDMSAVLTLARHPLIPFSQLFSLSWGHSFGIDRLLDYCLRSYIYLNILAEFPEWCQKEQYRELAAFRSLERMMTDTCDGDAQVGMHRAFYWDRVESEQLTDQQGSFSPSSYVPRDIFADLGRMKEYLKLCFAVLYRCDMVFRECEREIDWATEIAYALQQFHVDIRIYCTCYDGDCQLAICRESQA
ncbi:hypothetical protein BGZ72_004153 [Mortierella alpina]|nr:hypothetical protein BGZ72_004153 [Mortierella alpina]